MREVLQWIALLVLTASSAAPVRAECLILVPEPAQDVTRYQASVIEIRAKPDHLTSSPPPGGVWWIAGDSADVVETRRNGAPVELSIPDEGVYGYAAAVPDDAVPADVFSIVTSAEVEFFLPPVIDGDEGTDSLSLGSPVVHGGYRVIRQQPNCGASFSFSPSRGEDDVRAQVVVRVSTPPFELDAETPAFLIDVWLEPDDPDDDAFTLDARVVSAAPPDDILTDGEELTLVVERVGEWTLGVQLHDVRTGRRGLLERVALTITEPEDVDTGGGCSAMGIHGGWWGALAFALAARGRRGALRRRAPSATTAHREERWRR